MLYGSSAEPSAPRLKFLVEIGLPSFRPRATMVVSATESCLRKNAAFAPLSYSHTELHYFLTEIQQEVRPLRDESL